MKGWPLAVVVIGAGLVAYGLVEGWMLFAPGVIDHPHRSTVRQDVRVWISLGVMMIVGGALSRNRK
jgi:hypothetical protein